MIDLILAILALAAGVFSVIAAIGVIRFPDVLTRMHASSKVATFAGALALLAAALKAQDGSVTLRVVAAILLLFLTAPIGAHLIGRASAWRMGLGADAAEHGKRLINRKK